MNRTQRDLLVVAVGIAVTVTGAAATLPVVVLKIYPTIRRATRNLEISSHPVLSAASRISGLVSASSVSGIFLCDPITRFRNRHPLNKPPHELVRSSA